MAASAAQPGMPAAPMLWARCCLLLVVAALRLQLCSSLQNNTTRTPPMGMLNWGIFRCNIDCDKDPDTCVSERNIKGQIDAMVKGGYVKAGYTYVNIGTAL
jgi:hypothetical protein